MELIQGASKICPGLQAFSWYVLRLFGTLLPQGIVFEYNL